MLRTAVSNLSACTSLSKDSPCSRHGQASSSGRISASSVGAFSRPSCKIQQLSSRSGKSSPRLVSCSASADEDVKESKVQGEVQIHACLLCYLKAEGNHKFLLHALPLQSIINDMWIITGEDLSIEPIEAREDPSALQSFLYPDKDELPNDFDMPIWVRS